MSPKVYVCKATRLLSAYFGQQRSSVDTAFCQKPLLHCIGFGSLPTCIKSKSSQVCHKASVTSQVGVQEQKRLFSACIAQQVQRQCRQSTMQLCLAPVMGYNRASQTARPHRSDCRDEKDWFQLVLYSKCRDNAHRALCSCALHRCWVTAELHNVQGLIGVPAGTEQASFRLYCTTTAEAMPAEHYKNLIWSKP